MSGVPQGHSERRSALYIVGGVCLILQFASATFFVRSFETPNTSVEIADHLVRTGEFAVPGTTPLLRAYQLPGEPLYLAVGFGILPSGLFRYLHVPITVAFVVACAAVAFAIGGRRLAIATGVLASLDPFVIAHGPVWDDTFLAAAMEWTVLAIVADRLVRQGMPHRRGWLVLAIVFAAAGVAAATRAQSQFVMLTIGAALIAWRPLRPARAAGWAVVAGTTAAVGAWSIRNLLVLGVLFAGTSHDGLALLHANHPRARASILETGLAQTYADSRTPALLGELEADRFYRASAWAYVRAQPRDAAITAALKVAVSLSGADPSQPITSSRNVIAVATNVGLLALAVIGVRHWRREVPASPPSVMLGVAAVTIVTATLVMLAIGPVGLRYRISFAGLLYLGAAAGLAKMGRGVTAFGSGPA